MKKLEINKAKGDKELAVQSLTIIINKEMTPKTILPDGVIEGSQAFHRAMDAFYNTQAMQLAEALQMVLPGGTWDRFVGICVRRHASYLMTNREGK